MNMSEKVGRLARGQGRENFRESNFLPDNFFCVTSRFFALRINLINSRQPQYKKLNDDACSKLVNFNITVNLIVSYQGTS